MDAKRTSGLSLDSEAPRSNYLQLALRALAELSDAGLSKGDSKQLTDVFCQAFALSGPQQQEEVLLYLKKIGLTDTDIIDRIIPSAARRLGEQWVRDEMSFAQVSVGAARMQELARALSGRSLVAAPTVPLGLNVLLIIPQEEQHTMGAFVAADQLRRQGLWVHLAIGQTLPELVHTFASDHFSMIGISAAARKSVGSIKAITQTLRREEASVPIVLGGNILNLVDDVQAQTGVDYATSNPSEAIRICGMPAKAHLAVHTAEVV